MQYPRETPLLPHCGSLLGLPLDQAYNFGHKRLGSTYYVSHIDTSEALFISE